MSHSSSGNPTRRDLLKAGLFAGAGLALGGGRWPSLAEALERPGALNLITKPIPKSGEQVPVIGIGTNAYNLSDELRPQLRDTMRRFLDMGGKVYDTATGYARGESEAVLGELSSELDVRDRIFFVTKIVAPENNRERGRELFNTSLQRLKTNRIDGLLVHNLNGTDALIPMMQEWKQAGQIRYLGISTSSERQYEALMGYMRNAPLDIIQVDYSLGNRGAEPVLQLAQERGIAVMINVPFGGRRGASTDFPRLANTPIPGFAREYGIATWPQYFLKYLVSHPAVNMAIPGTRRPAHVEDNLGAAMGRLPDAATRKRMEEFYDALPE